MKALVFFMVAVTIFSFSGQLNGERINRDETRKFISLAGWGGGKPDEIVPEAAWFFPWDLGKVQRYADVIAHSEKRYYRRANGVAMMGFYINRDQFPLKSPERIEAELRTILNRGCYRVQVCSLNDVLKTPEVSAIFRKYFKKNKRKN